MTKEYNTKYSKTYRLHDYSRLHFCPNCEHHLTDMVDGSPIIYCPKCGQRVQIYRPPLCIKNCEYMERDIKTDECYCTYFKKKPLLKLDIDGSAIMLTDCLHDNNEVNRI